jgi:uncharacterized protein (TIGR02452 family)
MSRRENNKGIAEDTIKILAQGYFVNPAGECIDITDAQRAAQENTRLYKPQDSDALLDKTYPELGEATQYYITPETTLDAARRLATEGVKDVALLNFASAKNAGGGFLGGSQAQEESIARASGLYPCLLTAPEYYSANRHEKSLFYTDNMIFSPDVPIFKQESGQTMDNYILTAMITAPAVNRGAMKIKKDRPSTEIERVMKNRINKVLRIALEHGRTNIILGAWGCGVFQNSPEDIAIYFREVIQQYFANTFKSITFAIYSPNDAKMSAAFERAFSDVGFFARGIVAEPPKGKRSAARR